MWVGRDDASGLDSEMTYEKIKEHREFIRSVERERECKTKERRLHGGVKPGRSESI